MWDVKNKELWAEGKYNDVPVEFYEPMAEAGLKALIKICRTELSQVLGNFANASFTEDTEVKVKKYSNKGKQNGIK